MVRVIGCGNPDAGDDAAGLIVAEEIRRPRPARTSTSFEPAIRSACSISSKTSERVIVVDAVRSASGARTPGTLVRIEVGPDGSPAALRSSLSSHGLGPRRDDRPRGRGRGPPPDRLPRRRSRCPRGGLRPVGRGARRTPGSHRCGPRRRRVMKSDAATLDARRIQVRGIVQGVGFRPFVAGLAVRFGVTGWIRNDGGRVTIHAEAAPDVLDAFATAIRTEAPPLALVEAVESTATSRGGHTAFAVDPSIDADTGPRLAPPDAATCTRCLEELFDPIGSTLRLPLHQLHELRTSLHDHHLAAVRPREHVDARVRDVSELSPRIRGPRGSPLPRGADRVPDVRTAAAARGSGGTADRGRSGRARRGRCCGRARSSP